jgi:hypothetical protein
MKVTSLKQNIHVNTNKSQGNKENSLSWSAMAGQGNDT